MADDEENRGPPRGALVALALMVALIIAVVFVMHRLGDAARIQDCVASGRTNCAPIEAGRR
jgi:hypothetical protein